MPLTTGDIMGVRLPCRLRGCELVNTAYFFTREIVISITSKAVPKGEVR